MSEERGRSPPNRSDDLLGRRGSKLRKRLAEKLWNDIKRGFENQGERADRIQDYWDAYNCRLNMNQYYNGESEIFVPIVRDAINARATRGSNQLCPQGGEYIEAVATDGSRPAAIIDMLHEYMGDDFPVDIVEPLLKTGDIEGQYNVYVDWMEIRRRIVSRETRGPTMELGGVEQEMPGEEIEDIVEEDIIEQKPVCEILHDTDVLVLPSTADTVEEALASGGMAVVLRRWSKGKVEKMIDAGHITDADGKALLDQMQGAAAKESGQPPDTEKLLNEVSGVRKKGTEAWVWECWTHLPLSDVGKYNEDGEDHLCRIFFGPDQMALGCVRNPNWNDRVPLGSWPVEKVPGVFKGKSQVEPVISLQYEANDAANEGADVAHRSAIPVVFRHPAASNQPLIMNIGAVWDVDPNHIKFAEFPDLTPRAITRIQYCIQQIFQTLGVNPSMLPQQTNMSRRNQAQVAQEQQVDLLTTAIMTRRMASIMTWVMGWWVDLDYQYRDQDITVKTHGKQGVSVNMEAIAPFKTRTFYRFRWWGADQARFNAATFQQITAYLNVIASPQMQQQLQAAGKRVDFVPMLEMASSALLGPKYGALTIIDERANLSLDPEVENQMMTDGFSVPISPFDQHMQHIQAHQRAMQMTGDPRGNLRVHLQRHLIASQAQQMAGMMQAMQQQQQPGNQQGQGQRRGNGAAKPGSQPAGQRPMRGPPGMIAPEQLPAAGGIMMPRKM